MTISEENLIKEMDIYFKEMERNFIPLPSFPCLAILDRAVTGESFIHLSSIDLKYRASVEINKKEFEAALSLYKMIKGRN